MSDEKIARLIKWINAEIGRIESDLADPDTDQYEEGLEMRAEMQAYQNVLRMLK